MIKQKDVGIIIFRKKGRNIKYLLLRHQEGVYWKSPSGRVDPGEEGDEMLTALRELEEETGLKKNDIFFIRDFREEIEYDFDVEIEDGIKKKIYNVSVYYLAQTEKEKISISKEHLDWGWFDYETSLKRGYYQEQQDLLKKTHQYLLKKDEFLL
ncbi:NUDIX domain-containing protein [Patescibacteria group bacterium]|nr:NUDIX domain-containing protein [Patescibacteria group bacterium]